MTKEKTGLIDGYNIDGLRARGSVVDDGEGYGILIRIPLSDIGAANEILEKMWK